MLVKVLGTSWSFVLALVHEILLTGFLKIVFGHLKTLHLVAQGLKVDGPYVGLLSPVDGAEEGLSSLIRVGLSHPISKHISATLSLVEPVSDKIHLVKDSVTWKPGESGEKAFELKADENATEGHAKLLPLSVKLGEVVNADIHYGQNAEKILLLKKGQMPHFRVQPGKVRECL